MKLYDYILHADKGSVVVSRYKEEYDVDESCTIEIARCSNETGLSYVYETMVRNGVGNIYASSDMDFAKENGFKGNGDAHDMWDRAIDIYKTRKLNYFEKTLDTILNV